jgi:cytochrome P450
MTEPDVLTPQPPATDEPALWEWLRRMRDERPVHFDEKTMIWRVYRYEDVTRVMSEWSTFSNQLTRVIPQQEFIEGNMGIMDPPQHRKFRATVSSAFTPRMVQDLAPRIAEITHELIDVVADAGEMDFAADLAYPMPLIVIAELLGVPASDHALFTRWAEGLLTFDGEDIRPAAFVESVEQILREMSDYLRAHVRERQTRPRDDLISRLTTAEVDGQRLSEQEIANFARLLLTAGHLSTTFTLSNAVRCLDENPDAAAAVRADRSLVPGMLEEVMRIRPTVTDAARITNGAVALRGCTIPGDQILYVSILSANHDERQFPAPERFDIHRDPNPQLVLGHGIHYCLGAPLSRLELTVAVNILLDRFRELRVKPDAELRFYETLGVCGLQRLPVTFRCS